MQSKALSLLSAVALVATLCVSSSEAQTAPACVRTTKPTGFLPESIDCSSAKSIEDIQQFLRHISAGNGVKDFDIFFIHSNHHIRHLPAGLLEGLQFLRVSIFNCSQLSSADDFIGTSGASMREVKLLNNGLTEVPALTAPKLVNLKIIQATPWALSREALKGMTNIEEITMENIRVRPYAFLDLKNLKTLKVTEVLNEIVVEGAFHFASPVLEEVLIYNERGWQGQAQPGAYDGFVKGSRLRITRSPETPRDVYFNVLNSGAILDIAETVSCKCNVAWMRFAPFVSNAWIRCHLSILPPDLESTPEADYADCPRN